ncbi:transglutaminase-like cysteine peptidase [Microbulbifer sp. ARAS458-1]|uniref:transglutaminase-like cysteine peptidase n=1 Tax=Microbulbifer sp. ARAS458-1 TaxID=3140242 RepID=UPI0038779F8B
MFGSSSFCFWSRRATHQHNARTGGGRRYRGLLNSALLGLFAAGCMITASAFTPGQAPKLSRPLLEEVHAEYGALAHGRLVRWQQLIKEQSRALEWHRLLRINHFLNRVPYAEDRTHWGQEDFWATPVQFLASNGGDCEDYAIAKLFSLISAGISPEKIRLTYVVAAQAGQPHMVLLYSANPGEHPLVLDNMTSDVLPARERTDLEPVYSFNAQGLWLNASLATATKVRNQPGSALWSELMARMKLEGVFD